MGIRPSLNTLMNVSPSLRKLPTALGVAGALLPNLGTSNSLTSHNQTAGVNINKDGNSLVVRLELSPLRWAGKRSTYRRERTLSRFKGAANVENVDHAPIVGGD